jgi:hypothetical protein
MLTWSDGSGLNQGSPVVGVVGAVSSSSCVMMRGKSGWAGLGWAGLGWAGLGWAGLGWAGYRVLG